MTIPSERPYDPTTDLGALLAYETRAPTSDTLGRVHRLQQWLNLRGAPSASEYTSRLRIMLPAFALDLVQALTADEAASLDDPRDRT